MSKNKMITTKSQTSDMIDQIHADFKQATVNEQESLSQVLANLNIVNSEVDEIEELYANAAKLGINSKQASQLDAKRKEQQKLNIKKSTIEDRLSNFKRLQQRSSNQIIGYKNLHKILAKYNLCIGPADMFIGEMPPQAVQAANAVVNRVDQWFTHLNFDRTKFIFENVSLNGDVTKNPSFFVVAPSKDFQKSKDGAKKTVINNEILYLTLPKVVNKPVPPIPDPVLLHLVDVIDREPIFEIDYLWGKEAEYPEFK